MQKLTFTRVNYLIMLAGIALVFIGLLVMLTDKEPYGFGFAGITLGPCIIMTGFIVEFFAIFYKSKTDGKTVLGHSDSK